ARRSFSIAARDAAPSSHPSLSSLLFSSPSSCAQYLPIGSSGCDCGVARCAATSTSRREGCGGSRLPANHSPTMDKENQPSFAERIKQLRETAILLRDNAA